MHEGHRQRMIEKLSVEESLQDHELLEILLFNAIPRKNTNEIAHNLINACGGLSNVFKTDVNILASVNGVGKSTAAYLKTIGAIYTRIGENSLRENAYQAFSFHDFSEFVKERYKGVETEILELFALDGKNRIEFTGTFTSGDRDHVDVTAREVTQFIADHRPKGIAIAHNHPFGSSRPSSQDNEFTQLVQMLCSINNISLVEHVIIGQDTPYSYFLTGHLEEIKKRYDIGKIMKNPNPI